MEYRNLILMVFGFVLFVIAAVWNPEPHRHRLIAAGLACWILANIWK